MRILISAYHDSATCTWCNRTVEGVTAQFDGSFLQKGPLCWRCLQQATRVHNLQTEERSQASQTLVKGRSAAGD